MKKLPAFSVILVFSVLMIIGAGVIPLLDVRYTPSVKGSELNISYSWSGASAKLVESEVTSKLEGLISSVSGVKKISSVSEKGAGSITVEIKEKKKIDEIKFEISSLIRGVYKNLPKGVSYPTVSVYSQNAVSSPVIVFTVNATVPVYDIGIYCKKNVIKQLSEINGVNSVELSGTTSTYEEVSYDPKKLDAFKISKDALINAVSNGLSSNIAGSFSGSTIILKEDVSPDKIEYIPIRTINGKIIKVSDVAEVKCKEREANSYHRVNGLNAINISVYPQKYSNTITVCSDVREKMKKMESLFPAGFSVSVSYDTSLYLKKEIQKNLFRAFLSILFLFVFIILVSRSFKYLFVIFFSLIANILISFIFFVLFKMEIHLYSIAGMTVALGMIIDTSIVMVAHFGYYKNIKVFIAILAAQLTTIGALSMIYLLPEDQKANMVDFAGVVIINLSVSLVIAAFLIPALVDVLKFKDKANIVNLKHRRNVVKFNRLYAKYICYASHHKWLSVLILILAFGIPIDSLPDKIELDKDRYTAFDNNYGCFKKVIANKYNKTLGSDYFIDNIKRPLGVVLGGSIGCFMRHFSNESFYKDPERPVIFVLASLPDGCVVSQLNRVVMNMENYLTQFNEIDFFDTHIAGYASGGPSEISATIVINFKKHFENTLFPRMLKNQLISKAKDFGGANWTIYGVDDNQFSNNINTSYKSNRITISGYNYDKLFSFCQNSIRHLSKNKRVSGAGIYGDMESGNTVTRSEYYLECNKYKMASEGITYFDVSDVLQKYLNGQTVGTFNSGYGDVEVDVSPINNSSGLDVWHFNNEYIRTNDKQVKLSDVAVIKKKNIGNDIYRCNQQYFLNVAFDYVGTTKLAKKEMEKEVNRLNAEVLPLGYRANIANRHLSFNSENSIELLLLIVIVIFFICSVLFESFNQPLVIIGLIPVSLIGAFLVFPLTRNVFDQGGYASFVMLSGIVINAGIYIINQFNHEKSIHKYNCQENMMLLYKPYIKAFNRKIIPVLLTIISTILGLIPFLTDGPEVAFWFSFALGCIGGLIFSLIALVFFMPLWLKYI